MAIIKNKAELLSHGNIEGRKIALDIIEYAFGAIDTYESVRKTVLIDDGELIVGNSKYDLRKFRNIYVVGAGKGTVGMAEALEEILGRRIKRGVIIEKRGQGRYLQTIKVVEGGHPTPDEAGLEATKEIVEIAKSTRERDLVFVCIMGGCSALMVLPVEGVTLGDINRVNDLLLKCGATIEEINAVRKHLSAVKGGRLAKYIHPAEIINLIVIDEVAGLPWGPTVPDTTTFEDAVHVLKKYNLWEKILSSVRRHLERGLTDPSLETPKAKDFEGLKIHNLILANNNIACEAAKKKAEELGFNSMILSTVLEGESREVGIVLASIAKEVEKRNRPLKPPCVIISGGETTVTITEEPGEGGRNQELALAASLKIDGSEKIVIVSIGTDGTDGPTDIAGGIVDGYTLRRGKKKGLDVYKNLIKHNSSHVFRKLNDAVFTGPTGTNVMDLGFAVVLKTRHTT
ncbi:MAG: glycerate kinase [Candidatus Bathyarchaeota archaeon]|nr:glycerate kinase [Candidatus Bathyarchaeota archaeon]